MPANRRQRIGWGVAACGLWFAVMAGGAATAQQPPRIPDRYVGKWVGEAGKCDSFTLRQTGTAVVITDFGHTIDRFEFEVAADGKVNGSGTATYRFHAMSAANLLLTKRTDIAELAPKAQKVDFAINGTMSRYGRLHLHAAPARQLTLVNAGKPGSMAAWDVFGEVEAEVDASGTHLVADTFGVTVVAGKTTKIAWRARSAAAFERKTANRPAAPPGRIPKEYVGVWEGSGWEFSKQQKKVRQADVYVDKGSVINKFELNVAADGKVTGAGKATFWCDIAADAKLIMARQAPYAFLEGNIAKIEFDITGTMSADGKLNLKSTVTHDLPLINVGNRDTLKVWDVFDGLEATVLAGGPALLAKADVAQGADRRVIWKAKKVDYQVVVHLVKPGTAMDVYDTWLPEAKADEKTPGSRVEVRATLEKMGGGEPEQKARKFVFDLVDVSREPGICMNWPPKDSTTTDPDPDLQFHPDSVQSAYPPDVKQANVIGREGTSAETPNGIETAKSYANLAAHDWGAFGVLRVTAEVIDGPPVVGFLKGHRNQTNILLPKRKPDSFIADRAKELAAERFGADVANRPDDYDQEDDEQYPGKNKYTGDGLTYYQEYRGFYVKGEHQRGDPKKKDFFLCNTVPENLDTAAGIKQFENASGLKVWQLKREEMSDKRVINFNRSNQTPHRVDQHGVLMRLLIKEGDPRIGTEVAAADSPLPADGVAATRPRGNPKKVTAVVINPDYRWDRHPKSASTWAVAHELGHAVALRHHGEGPLLPTGERLSKDDTGIVWTIKLKPNGDLEIKENGKVIEVRAEDDKPSGRIEVWKLNLTQLNQTSMQYPVWLGVPGGEHSGDVNCMMRYNTAFGYRSKSDPKVRYVIDNNGAPGKKLCIDKAGNDWNSRLTEARFGDASNGECRFKICVCDAYDPP